MEWLIGLFGLLFGIIGHAVYLSYRFGRLSLQVDTIWEFLMRRAKAEFVTKGFGAMKSPLQLNPESLASIQSFVNDLIPFYAALLKKNPSISDNEIYMELERAFGDRILETICIPKGLNMGACLILLAEGCKTTYANKKSVS